MAWFSPPVLFVPSSFYAGEDFPPATSNDEFSKSSGIVVDPTAEDGMLIKINTPETALYPQG